MRRVEVVCKTIGKQGSVFAKPYGLALFLRLASVCVCVPMETIYPTSCVHCANAKMFGARTKSTHSSNNHTIATVAAAATAPMPTLTYAWFSICSFSPCLAHCYAPFACVSARVCVRRMCVYVCWGDVYRNAPCVVGARRAWKIHFLKSAVSLCCYFHTCASVSCVLWTE